MIKMLFLPFSGKIMLGVAILVVLLEEKVKRKNPAAQVDMDFEVTRVSQAKTKALEGLFLKQGCVT